MDRQIIYKPNSPKAVTLWSPKNEDQVMGHHASVDLGIPAVVFVVTLAILGIIDLLFIPEYADGFLDLILAGVTFSAIGVVGAYHLWRNVHVDLRTSNTTMLNIEHMFRRLPSELQAEGSQIRALAIGFTRDNNQAGLNQCESAINELLKAFGERTTIRHNKEARDPEVGRVKDAAMRYREETNHIFAGEIGAGPASKSEHVVEEVDAEIVPDDDPYMKQRRKMRAADWVQQEDKF